MGKGNRNRINREAEPKKEVKFKKKVKHRKPLSPLTKRIIAGAVCLLLAVGIVFGSLVSAGTFKRNNIVVRSKTGTYDLDQQTATYMVWDASYYQAYVQWSYLQDTIKQMGFSDQTTWCLYSAQVGVQETLLTSLNTFSDSLREYIAVCDYATQNGISLSKEEKKTAKEEMRDYIEYMASATGTSLKGFINFYIGCKVKMKDIEKAAEIQALCQKVYEQEQDKHGGTVDADTAETIIKDFVKNNPESFYTTDYYVANGVSPALKDLLLAATSADDFKAILVKDALDNGVEDKNKQTITFKSQFNKYCTTLITEASNTLAAIKDKNESTISEALTGQQMTAIKYDKADETLNAELKKWLFETSKGALYAADIIYTADTIYVAVITSAITDNKVDAAVKTITKQDGTTLENDANFKDNFYKTVLAELGLYEKQENDKLYTDTEVAGVKSMLTDLTVAIEGILPELKSEGYLKQQENTENGTTGWSVGSYQEWMFKGTDESFNSPVAAGAVKEFAEKKTTNGETTETGNYNVYIIVDPIKLDEEPLVNGGYIKFTGEGHAAEAQSFLESLAGLTGDALAEKFSSFVVGEDSVVVATPTVNESIAEDGITETALSDWLFDAARAANNTTLIAIADDASTTTTGDACTYVAFYLDQKPTWKVDAKNGYINEMLSDWVDGMIINYELATKGIKDKTKVEAEESTTTAA